MSGLFDAYLKGDARAFFGLDPMRPGDRLAAVARAARPLSEPVAAALTAQNARYCPSGARDAHLAALRRGAAAVVTGQQVGLFLGPLYTIYKAATAIRVARALSDESGREVVPIFWLQSEDHDLAEISTCKVARPHASALDLSLPLPDNASISIAHRKLPDDVLGCLATLRETIAALPHGEEHLALLERHYRPGAGWVDAFAGALAELFAEEGLILVDPRDGALAACAAPIHARAITEATAIAEALEARSQELIAAGYEPAVFVRPWAPLSFFHPDGITGPRYRLDPRDGGYAVPGASGAFSAESLIDALQTEPLSFSTSALLRPIVQDALLPTAAYVGGPGEVAYFAQLAPVYAAFDVAMPLIVARARFRIVDDATGEALSQLELTADDMASPEQTILARRRVALPAELQPAEVEETLIARFEGTLETLTPPLISAGEGMASALDKTRGTVRMAVSKLRAKYEKALLHGDPKLVGDVRRLKRLLYPDDTPQERVYGLPSFAALFGQRAFVAMVLAGVVPFDPEARDLP